MKPSEPVIRFDRVSKRFLLNVSQDRSLMDLVLRPFRHGAQKTYFWALQDIDFEVPSGSTLGLVGENGSGKSTILKLIARILEPTAGTVSVSRRVSSLLELGASFHPELTGRENVYLAASIARVPKEEIARQLDEIIDFADIYPYVDVPVKHYSSGMYVRLGFAVAIHVRPEILVVDEVLAVGDEAFQHKCFQSVGRLQREGATIVFVSHSTPHIIDLCDSALWIHEGRIRSRGEPRLVVADYLAESSAKEQGHQVAGWAEAGHNGPVHRYERGAPAPDARRWGDGSILIRDARLTGPDGRPTTVFHPEDSMQIEFDYEVQRPVEAPAFGIAIYRSDQVWCYGTNTAMDQAALLPSELPDRGTVVAELPEVQLLQGEYVLDLAAHSSNGSVTYDYIRDVIRFYVQNPRGDQGVFRPRLCWRLPVPAEKVVS